MNRLRGFLYVIAVLSVLIGTLTVINTYNPAVPSGPRVVMETLDPSLEQFEAMWRDEIGRRFDNAVGVLVHGGDFVEGQWIAGTHVRPDKHVTLMTKVVEDAKKKHSGRTVVLLACNTGNLKLGIPGVFYATSSVWCIPDRAIRPEMYQNANFRQTLGGIVILPSKSFHQMTRWEWQPDYVGNVWEFVKD